MRSQELERQENSLFRAWLLLGGGFWLELVVYLALHLRR
jgi:hypothetical protein